MERFLPFNYNEPMRRPGIPDIIIFLIYISAIAVSALAAGGGNDVLEVDADGREYAYSLSENGLYDFEGPLGTTVIEIKDGRARIVSSPCPNGTCMKAGWSSTLCCLPNKIIAVSTASGDVDAISG